MGEQIIHSEICSTIEFLSLECRWKLTHNRNRTSNCKGDTTYRLPTCLRIDNLHLLSCEQVAHFFKEAKAH